MTEGSGGGRTAADAMVPEVLPVWPVRHAVIFPHGVAPLGDVRGVCVAAVTEAFDRCHGLCLFLSQRNDADEQPAAEALYDVGTIAMIMQVAKVPGGGVQVLVRGLRRARLQRLWLHPAAGYRATFDLVDDPPFTRTADLDSLLASVRATLDDLCAKGKTLVAEVGTVAKRIDHAGDLADLVLSSLNVDVPTAQQVLELHDPVQRLVRAQQIAEGVLDPDARLDTTARLEGLERIYERQFPGNDPNKIDAFLKAATMYRQMRMPARAIPLYEKVLAIQRATEDREQPPSLARVETLGHLAMVLSVAGRSAEAIAPLNEVIAILRTHYPAEQQALYSAMNGIATQHADMGRFAEAERAYLDILKLADSGFDARKQSVAATHNNLGSLYLRMKDYDRAEASLLASLALKREVFGRSHPEIGIALYNLATFYGHTGQPEKAKATHAEAVTMLGRDPSGN